MRPRYAAAIEATAAKLKTEFAMQIHPTPYPAFLPNAAEA